MRSSKIDKDVVRTCASRCAEFLYDMHAVLESTPTCSMHDIVRGVEALLRVFVMLLKGIYIKCTLPRPRTSRHFSTALLELGDAVQKLRVACKAFGLAHVNLPGASATAKAAVVHSAIDLKVIAENFDTIRSYLDHLLGLYGDNDAKWWFEYLAVFKTCAENISTAARASGDITTWMAAVEEEPQQLGLTASSMVADGAVHERTCTNPAVTQNTWENNDPIKLRRHILELKEFIEEDMRDSKSTAVSEDSAASRALLIRDIEMMEGEL